MQKEKSQVPKGILKAVTPWIAIGALITGGSALLMKLAPESTSTEKEKAPLEERISKRESPYPPIRAHKYGGSILWEDIISVSRKLNIDAYGWARQYIKGNEAEQESYKTQLAESYRKHVGYIQDIINGGKEVLKEDSLHRVYDRPFRLALYASANAPRVYGRLLEGNKNWKTREYTITPNGLPPKDSKEPTMTFVDAPRNDEIGEHLIFKGKYKIDNEEKELTGIYNIQEPLKSWVYFDNIEDQDFIHILNRTISKHESKRRKVGSEAVNILKEIMEFYRKGISDKLESLIQTTDNIEKPQGKETTMYTESPTKSLDQDIAMAGGLRFDSIPGVVFVPRYDRIKPA